MASGDTPTRYAIIMAGGAGERFWPFSRLRRPKQLLPLTHPRNSMLQETVRRNSPLIPPEHICVITAESLVEPIRQAGTGIPDEQVLGEPERRNTAGCLAYAAAWLMAYRGAPENMTMAVVTTDHLIGDEEAYLETVAAACEAAERHDALVTIGIHPTRPETGLGYVEIPENAAPVNGAHSSRLVYPVERFLEKPDVSTAESLVDSGRAFWNSGMFFWKVSTFLGEADKACLWLSDGARNMAQAMRAGDRDAFRNHFLALESKPIDVALMEQTRNVLMARGDFVWDDVGAWDALGRTRQLDENGNVIEGHPVLVDTKNCIVLNDPGHEDMSVAVIGGEDLIVVAMADAVLVAPKNRAQDVKKAVQELAKRKAKHL